MLPTLLYQRLLERGPNQSSSVKDIMIVTQLLLTLSVIMAYSWCKDKTLTHALIRTQQRPKTKASNADLFYSIYNTYTDTQIQFIKQNTSPTKLVEYKLNLDGFVTVFWISTLSKLVINETKIKIQHMIHYWNPQGFDYSHVKGNVSNIL